MRRLLHILLLALLPLLSCTRELESDLQSAARELDPEGRVRITFSCSLPDSSPVTKALGEASELTSMHLAVFGSSGYYKEYIKAEQVGEKGTASRTFYDKDGNPVTHTVDTYVFQADIKLSNTARTIHFLGNGPTSIKIGNAKDVLPSLLCDEGKTGFWQMIMLDEIKAQTDDDGNYLSPYTDTDGNYLIHQPGEPYLIHEDTQNAFEILKDENGNPVLDAQGNVQGGIALIRNWSKIIIRNNWSAGGESLSHFTPYSFAVINVPKQGSVVPYGGKTGFIGPDKNHPNRKNYKDLDFDELTREDGEFAYKGNLPDGIEFDLTIPSIDAFENPQDATKNPGGRVVLYNKVKDLAQAEDEPAVYLYERTVPTTSSVPTSVIIYGKYYDPEDITSLTDEERAAGGVNCFYKVDLMDSGTYYPILRNFRYQVQIKSIASRGFDTPESAAAAAGSADVSADVNAAHLSDISDGKRRMAIQPYMSYTFIEGDEDVDENGDPVDAPAQLYVKFYDDITSDPPSVDMRYDAEHPDDPDLNSVTWSLSPDGGGVILRDEVTIGPPDSNPGDSYGWRPIYFKVSQPGEISRTQTLRISCTTWDPERGEHGEYVTLYREIVLTLQPIQPMKVKCENERVLRYAGQEQSLSISIPAGLVESMFPLVFQVEPQEMTLTPDNSKDNGSGGMPVVTGMSINPNNDKPRFHFERTLTWDEYRALQTTVEWEDESRWKTFSCYFKTNCVYSGTEIWVANKYFVPNKDSFIDYRSFKDPAFTTPIPKSTNTNIGVKFGVEAEDDGNYEPVFIRLKNMTWDGHDLVPGKDFYALTPTQNDNTLSFRPTEMNGDVAVTLFTEDDAYEAVTLTPWRFTNVGFIGPHAFPNNAAAQWGSNVVFEMVNQVGNKSALFGFCVDSGSPTPLVSFLDQAGVSYTSNNGTLNLAKTNPHSSVSPYNGREDFYWVNMNTVAGTSDASVTISATGYIQETVTAGRFNGNQLSQRLPPNDLKYGFVNKNYMTDIAVTQSCYAAIEFDIQPGTSDAGLILEKGKTYTMTVTLYEKNKSGTHVGTTGELASIQIEYLMSGDVPQAHLSYDIIGPEDSFFYQYWGNKAEYIWSIPRDPNRTKSIKTAEIKLKAPNSRNAVINVLRVWGFKSN